MKQSYLDVDKHWGIVIVTDFDVVSEQVELKAQLRSFGLSNANANKALDVLSKYNTGMTVSVPELRMSAVYIGRATSSSEFWSTLNHELYHCCVAIIDYYGEPYNKEPAAYLQGELMRLAVEAIGEPCR